MNFQYLTTRCRPITQILINSIAGRSYAKTNGMCTIICLDYFDDHSMDNLFFSLIVEKADRKQKMAMAETTRRLIPVETDTRRLVRYVCGSNYYQEGEDIQV